MAPASPTQAIDKEALTVDATLAAVAAACPIGFVVTDSAGRVIHTNVAYAALVGQPTAELAGASLGKLHPELADIYSAAQDTPPKEHLNLRVGGPGGRCLGVRLVADQSGAAPRLLHFVSLAPADECAPGKVLEPIIRPQPDRRSGDSALEASEARYRALFENVPIGVYRSTPDRRVIAANPALLQMLGFSSEEEFRAHGIADDLYADPRQRETFLRRLEVEGEYRNVEIELRKRDGGLLVALSSVRAIRDKSGALAYFEGSLADITPQRQNADLLAAQQRGLEMIIRGAPLPGLFAYLCITIESLLGDCNALLVDERGDDPLLYGGVALSTDARANLLSHSGEDWREEFRIVSNTAGTEFGQESAVGSCWARALLAADGERCGRLLVTSAQERTTQDYELRVLTAAAQVASIAMDSDTAARLRNQLFELLEATTDLVATFGPDGHTIYCNQAMRGRLGLSEADVAGGLNGLPFLTATSRRRVRDEALPAARKHGSWDGELSFRARDGSEFPTSLVVLAHRDAGGHVDFYSGIGRDISARLDAERALRLSEARNRLLVEHASESILVIALHPFRIDDLNDKATELFGRSREEMIGIDTDLLTLPQQPDGRNSREVISAHLQKAYRGKPEVTEFTFVQADGTTVPCELHLSRLPSENRKLIRASLYDISKRKRAETALLASEARFKGIFNRTLGFVSILDPEGRIIDLNRTSLATCGVKRKDVIGAYGWDGAWFAGLPDEVGLFRKSFGKALQGATVRNLSHYRHRNGEARTLERTMVPIYAENGGLEMVLVEGRDVTEHRRDERKLEQYAERLEGLSQQLLQAQEKERRHIARELHDEIGQSLTALKFNLLATRARFDAADPRALFNDSIEIVENVLGQVRSLSLDLRPSMLDDLGLVATLRWYLHRQASRGSLEAHFDVFDADLRLPQDLETVCYRVAQEAINNVLKHACAKRISVTLAVNDAVLELVVADDGVGFDIEGRSAAANRGASFGLVGMRERAALAGGNLRVSSSSSGSEVRATFPLRGAGKQDDWRQKVDT